MFYSYSSAFKNKHSVHNKKVIIIKNSQQFPIFLINSNSVPQNIERAPLVFHQKFQADSRCCRETLSFPIITSNIPALWAL